MNCKCTGLLNARRELFTPMFSQHEPPLPPNLVSSGESTSRLDISKTFSPRPYFVTIPFKLLINAWVISSMILSIHDYTFPNFWLAYLTNWGWIVTMAYFVFSLGMALCFVNHDDNSAVRFDHSAVRFFVNVTWASFAIALPAEIGITILYWFLLHDGNLYYTLIMFHGVGALLLLIDGLVINRIPLRSKHFLLLEGFWIAYLVWNLIFTYSDMTNPYQEAGYQDDDALYSTFRWKINTKEAISLSVILLLVLNPLLFFICRGMSRMLPRRLASVEDEKSEGIGLGQASSV